MNNNSYSSASSSGGIPFFDRALKKLLVVVITLLSMTSTFFYFIEAFPNLMPSWVMGDLLSKIAGGLWGVFLLDGSALIWLRIFSYSASSEGQRSVALGLSVIDMLGAGLTSLLYVLMRSSGVVMTEMMSEGSVWVLSLITFLNFVGVWVFNQQDSETQTRSALTDARSEIAGRVNQQLRQNVQGISAVIAEQVAAKLTNDVRESFLAQVREPQSLPAPEAPRNSSRPKSSASVPPVPPVPSSRQNGQTRPRTDRPSREESKVTLVDTLPRKNSIRLDSNRNHSQGGDNVSPFRGRPGVSPSKNPPREE